MPVIDLNKVRTENHWWCKTKDTAKRLAKATGQKVKETIDYVKENPQGAATIVGIGVTLVGGATKLGRTVNKHREIRQEKWHRDREIYDHSANTFLVTRRKLKSNEIAEMNRRMRETGKKKAEVLRDMNLLKK